MINSKMRRGRVAIRLFGIGHSLDIGYWKLGILPRRVLAMTIRFYQHTLSPDHGPLWKWLYPHGFCRYHPSCSEYGRLAILQNGIFFGSMKTMWRVLRCNPFSRGGVDNP